MAYCTQEDLEDRLTKAGLIQLLTDLKNVVIPSSPRVTIGLGSSGVLSAGAYKYRVVNVYPTYDSIDSESSNQVTISDPATEKEFHLADIAIGGSGCTARKIFRTTAGGSTFYLAATIPDNTTTVLVDGMSDTILAAASRLATYVCKGVDGLIAKADALIDAKSGQVYTVPFVTVPKMVKNLSIDISCYYAMQRRFTELEMPKDWLATFKQARADLQGIADQEIFLDATTVPVISSAEAQIVANDQVFDFANQDSPMSDF